MRKISTILILSLLTACNLSNNRVLLGNKNIYEIKRQYSPDKTKILLTYGDDEGATGEGEVGTAILKLPDTSKDVSPFTISWDKYNDHAWINNDTAIFYLDYLKKMRKSKFINSHYDTLINGIHIMYDYKDLIDSSYNMDTLFNKFSPDKNYRLVVYQYINKVFKNNFINISIINFNDTIPKYGNFFIGDLKDDYINNCDWLNSNELAIYTTSSCEYIIQNFMVNRGINVPYKIVVDDKKYSDVYWWTKKAGY